MPVTEAPLLYFQCKYQCFKNIRDTVSSFNNKQRCVVLTDTAFGKKEITFLTEQGLYEVLFISRKPIAKWVFKDNNPYILYEQRKYKYSNSIR